MIHLSKNQILNLPELGKYNSGSYGICYKYKDEVLKLLFTDICKIPKEERVMIEKRINNLLDTKIENVSFPLDVTRTPYYFAYTMPYIKGIDYFDLIFSIYKDEMDLSFDELLKNYLNAINKVKEISSEGIEIVDLNLNNCKYKDDASFGIIDVDFYKKVEYKEQKKLLDLNLETLNDSFRQFFNSFTKKKELNITNIYLKDYSNPNFMEEAINYVDKKTGSDIISLGKLYKL